MIISWLSESCRIAWRCFSLRRRVQWERVSFLSRGQSWTAARWRRGGWRSSSVSLRPQRRSLRGVRGVTPAGQCPVWSCPASPRPAPASVTGSRGRRPLTVALPSQTRHGESRRLTLPGMSCKTLFGTNLKGSESIFVFFLHFKRVCKIIIQMSGAHSQPLGAKERGESPWVLLPTRRPSSVYRGTRPLLGGSARRSYRPPPLTGESRLWGLSLWTSRVVVTVTL